MLFIASGSAPISGEVLEVLKACFSCDVTEGVRPVPIPLVIRLG